MAIFSSPDLAGLNHNKDLDRLLSTSWKIEVARALGTPAAVEIILRHQRQNPSEPVHGALEPLLASIEVPPHLMGERNKLVGRLVRMVMEHLGFRWRRKGVPAACATFVFGSIYGPSGSARV